MSGSEPDAADRVAEAFDRIVDEPASRHPELLERHCGEDPQLRREVASLLRAHRASEGSIDRLDLARAAALLAWDEDRGAIERAGPYRLIAEIGRGGMGTVYLAERVEGGFDQRVAVKLLKRGMDSDAIVERFVTERRILASLEHPRIARLLDGGLAEDGRPYFAMEYVEGETLLSWCDRRRLPLAGRLELFERICRAVQHAHARLVLHRDLKPANILVTADGEPKLLDFSIAKLLAESGGDEAAVTAAGRRPMTPEYAAPEQVRGEPVTVATDVYSLGVILYELLTGWHPYAGAAASRGEVEHAVCATRPPAPSAALTGEQGREDAATRGARLDRLRRRLRGDLDTIVLKALAKEPERRYASVEALAEDLRAYLGGLPVKARPETLSYRVRRFAGRHRAAVATGAAAVLALVAGLALALWQARIAQQERDRAHLEADRALRVESFLSGLFEASNPGESRGEEVTTRELLERGTERIERELAGQPASQADLLGVIGGVYVRLGRYDRATELLARGVALSRDPAADPLQLAGLLKQLGESQTLEGRYEEGRASLEESLVLRRRLAGAQSLAVAQSLDALAINRHQAGELDRAEALYRQAWTIHAAELGEDHPTSLATLNNLADMAAERGRFGEAVALHRRILALILPIFGDDHPEVAVTLNNLATALRRAGQLAEAVETQRRALAIKTKVLDADHPSLATSWSNLAVALRDLGDFPEAEAIFDRVLSADFEALGAEHPYVAISLDNLASVVAEQGRTLEALELLDRAAEIHRRSVDEDSVRFAAHRQVRARALEIAGRRAEAAALFDRCLATYRRQLDDRHHRTTRTLVALARVRLELDGPEAAEHGFREALSLQRSILAAQHPDLAVTLLGLGGTLLRLDRAEEAEPLLAEALRIRRAVFPVGHWRRAEARALVAAGACARGRTAEGARQLRPALEALAERPGADHPDTLRARTHGAACSVAAEGAAAP